MTMSTTIQKGYKQINMYTGKLIMLTNQSFRDILTMLDIIWDN